MKVDPALKNLSFLLGKWKSICAHVKYPTMKKTIEYTDIMEFNTVGLPIVNYMHGSQIQNKASHMERGFIKIHKDGCRVVLLTAQNFGVCTMELGIVKDNNLIVGAKDDNILHSELIMNHVKEIQRTFRVNEKGQLEVIMFMATPQTPLTEHLNALYEKCS